MAAVKTGLIGCGAISGNYLNHLRHFAIVDIAACADLNPEAAKSRGEEFGIPKVCSVDDLLADGDIELVLNLTIPRAHAPVNLAALEHGKHAYCEKPFAVNREEATTVIEAARSRKLRVGGAPDTVFGPGIQTCRRLIDEGAIGIPTAATAFCCGRGHEHWHASPAFYYDVGAGPLFDMGVYYLTALVVLLGPVGSVLARHKATFSQRTASSEGAAGLVIDVKVPTHLAGILEFRSGVIATTTFSFDTMGGANLPRIEIYGTEGTLSVPDPNGFDGPVSLKRIEDSEWQPQAHTHKYISGRGLGLADFAHAIRENRHPRADAPLPFHVLDIMQAFHESGDAGNAVDLDSTCERPEPMPEVLPQLVL